MLCWFMHKRLISFVFVGKLEAQKAVAVAIFGIGQITNANVSCRYIDFISKVLVHAVYMQE